MRRFEMDAAKLGVANPRTPVMTEEEASAHIGNVRAFKVGVATGLIRMSSSRGGDSYLASDVRKVRQRLQAVGAYDANVNPHVKARP